MACMAYAVWSYDVYFDFTCTHRCIGEQGVHGDGNSYGGRYPGRFI
jgi:hypothetical protein